MSTSAVSLETPQVAVRLSGGAASAIAAMRCVEWFGVERVVLLFADTSSESEDNYRLVRAVHEKTGCELAWLKDGRNIWDVFDAEGVMRLPRGGCKASQVLKHRQLDQYVAARWPDGYVTHAFGLTWQEPERQERLRERLLKLHMTRADDVRRGVNTSWVKSCVDLLFPLNERPLLAYCDILDELERYGLPVSAAYRSGYPHDNCNGGCVLAGIGQWSGLLKDNPTHFRYCEDREWAFYQRTGFTVLKDRRGGVTRSYPLRQLREDIEAGRETSDDWRSGCGCMFSGGPE